MLKLILLLSLTTFGSTISGLTGLGGGVILLGSLSLFYTPDVAIPLHGIVQIVSNGSRIILFLKLIRWDVVWRYALLIVPGAYLGGLLFNLFNLNLMQILIGTVILLSLYGPSIPKDKFSFTRNSFIWLGFVSGFLAVLVGSVGPMITPFFDKIDIKRDDMVSTKSACQIIIQLSKVAAFSGVVGVDFGHYRYEILMLIAAAILGTLLVRPVGKYITDQQFDKILMVLLTIIGAQNIYAGLVGYLKV